MSLNWDATKVDDYEALKTDAEWPVTEAVIFYTMFVGVREITEANAEKFATRIHMWEQLNGTALSGVGDDGEIVRIPVTLADVRRRVGLSTNATPYTDAKFNAEIARIVRERADAAIYKAKTE